MATQPARSIVVAGLGRHADKIVLPAIEASPHWRLAGLVSGRPDAAARRAADLGTGAFPTIAAAVAATGADAVYLAGLPAVHHAGTMEALDAGAPVVVCEKPLGVDGSEARDMLERAEASDALLYEVVAYQHHPQFEALERLIGSDEIGGLVHGYARFSFPYLPEGDFRYRPDDGGGALLDAGVYPLSLAVHLLGGGDLRVQASEYRGAHDVDVAGAATLTDGAGRSFQCSWGMGSAYANTARIVGTAGTVEVPRPFSKPAAFDEPLQVIGGWGERTAASYDAADQFVRMMNDLHLHADDREWRAAAAERIAARWAVLDRVRASAVRSG